MQLDSHTHSPPDSQLFGGVEAGGTKFVCMVGSGPQDIRAEIRFATTTPDETIGRTIEFFEVQAKKFHLNAIGIGAFGPVNLDPASPTFGFVTTTPKPGWSQANVAGTLRSALQIPVAFDTDVNVAAMGEYRWGAAQNIDPSLYMTIGTGIGAGGIVNGRPLHGLVHPEVGHMRIPHDWQADPFSGTCPYHGDCFEGLACGPALQQRWGQPGHTLPDDHPAWDLEARYIAMALTNLICSFSPRRIVLGGGVMQQSNLFPLVRGKVQHLLNGYIQSPQILEQIEQYIVPPGLGNRSGVLGAIALAMDYVQKHHSPGSQGLS
jgi:fructokinase